MKPIKAALAGLAILNIFASGTRAAITTIYQHNFSGPGGENLNGRQFDSATGTHGSTLGATWLANERFKADGSTVSAIGSSSAYVPFSPLDGYIYTISMDMAVTGYTGNSRTVMSLLSTAGSPNVISDFTTANNYATIGRRASSYTDAGESLNYLTWGGAGTANASHSHESFSGSWNLSIVLNTSVPGAWTYQLLGTSISGLNESSAIFTLPSAVSLGHIMINNHHEMAAALDNFTVTVEAVPEPRIPLLSSLFLGAVLLSRQRRFR